MPKCKNDVLIQKVGLKKLSNTMEVDFDVLRRMPDCNRINAKNYYGATQPSPTYDKWKIPEDVFECDKAECVNTGTLSGFGTIIYRIVGPTYNWANGIILFYGTPAKVPYVEISADPDFTNSDKYQPITDMGLRDTDPALDAYVVDLSQAPSSTTGTGWARYNATGAFIRISGTGFDDISSIAIFEDALDFNTSTVVKVGCLTGIDGSFDLEVAEATCFNPASYDADALTSIERTITGTSVTANYMLLNPLISRGKEDRTFDIETIEAVPEGVGSWGGVQLPDLDTEQCGRIAVSVAGVCAPHDGILTRISAGSIALEGDQFALVKMGNHNTPTLLVNSILIGKTLTISYPKRVDAESYDICADNLDGVRTRMTYTKCHTDGAKYRYVYDNVLVTSFPDGITNDGEQEFSFTVTILKGKDGCFGHVYRIYGN